MVSLPSARAAATVASQPGGAVVWGAAEALGVRGYVRNLDDGRVEVYAIGLPEQLSNFAGMLWKGPRMAEVRGVDEDEAPVEKVQGFTAR